MAKDCRLKDKSQHVTSRYTNFRPSVEQQFINPSNGELNPICHLLALLGAHHILHVSRIRVKLTCSSII